MTLLLPVVRGKGAGCAGDGRATKLSHAHSKALLPAVKTRVRSRLACLAYLTLVSCLAPSTPPVRAPSPPLPNVRALPERPSVAVVVREGDPRAAIAVAVLTAGAFDAAGPRVPVALAAVTEARLATAGLTDVSVAAT